MRYYIFFLMMLAAASVQAQTGSDQIFKTDQSVIQAVVDEIGDTEILYFLPKDTAKRNMLRIPKQHVWKIVYENGETEIINTPKTVAAINTRPAEIKPDSAADAGKASDDRKTSVSERITVSVGLEGNYIAGSAIWADREEGVGLLTLPGVNMRGSYQLAKSVSGVLTLGYSQAAVKKNYMAGNELLYQTEVTLSGPNAGLGITYTFKKPLYLLLQGQGNFLKMKTSRLEGGKETQESASAVCPSVRIGAGVSKSISRIVVQAELYYQFMQSTFKSASDPFHMAGVRVGIGLAGFEKN